MEYIKLTAEGNVGVLTINRPAALNALNDQVIRELNEALDSIDLDTVRCLVVTGEGQKAFVAGADIGQMRGLTKEEGVAFGKLGNDVFRKLETLPIPTIAAVCGFALGGGCELAMSCDIRLCSDTAVFGQPEVGLGITPGFGGTQRLASVTEKLVPVMAIFYICGSLIAIGMNAENILPALKSVFVGAFTPQAVMGGAIGISIKEAVRFGVARGLFSNEAGMGSTPHAHAAAEVAHPADQGLVAMMGVFIDTFIILTLTALVILSTGVLGNGETGSVLAQSAFNAGLGTFGPVFIAFCMLFFAFTTIVGWYYFGEVNVRALFGDKAVKVYAVIVILCVAVGSTLKVDLVWNMSDMFNGLMVLPNLIALLPCIEIVKKLTKEYELKK